MNYETTIGLEVHIQLNTKSKMFCGCDNNAEGREPNTTTCPVCSGMPGTLPMANKAAIEKTLLLGLALEAKLSKDWNFERKNYFYPDLPKGYQITSASNPPVVGGEVKVFDAEEDRQFIVHLHHLHLEEDAGKLIHGDDQYSFVDLNRAGTPLIELVTAPDIKSVRDAKVFLQEIQIIVRRLGISEADMEKGHLRCDANISLKTRGAKKLGSKVEIKNLNSFRMVERALKYEEERQSKLLDNDEMVIQETRGWDDGRGVTMSQRGKEDVHDYRYLPEPDLPPIHRMEVVEFSDDKLRSILPELPYQERERLLNQYRITREQAHFCVADPAFGLFVAQVYQALPDDASVDLQSAATRILFGDLRRLANEARLSFYQVKLTAKDMAEMIELNVHGQLSNQILKTHLPRLLSGQELLQDVTKLFTPDQEIDLDVTMAEVLAAQPRAVKQYQAGDTKVLGFLIGQVMSKTKGMADPATVKKRLEEMLQLH